MNDKPNNNYPPVGEHELHAYVDGQLPVERILAVEAYLVRHPSAAERVQDLRKLNRLLSDRYARALEEPVPKALCQQAQLTRRQKAGQPKARTVFLPRMAASIFLLVCGGVIGWLLHGDSQQQAMPHDIAFAQQAAFAHAIYTPEVRHPVEVAADNEQHLVKWLSKRLGTKVRAPDLLTHGYELVGGRMLPNNDKPVAQFMYENKPGERLTLYIRAEEGKVRDVTFNYLQQNGLSVFYWEDSGLSYALTGKIDKSSLINVATTVHQSLGL